MWDNIHKDIREAAQQIAETGKYDDAIFAAFRYLEGEIQERINSRSIGKQLLDEAFDGNPPKINISDDLRDREGIKEIFSGALSNIRNDRGHKKSPFLPCQSLNQCLLYLSFASFLLHLLSKDKNSFPTIESIRLLGTYDQPRVELRGINFSTADRVLAEGVDVSIVRVSPTVIEAILPAKFSGIVKVVAITNESNEIYCDTHTLEQGVENLYEIIRADIPLFEDAACTRQRKDVVGLLLRVTEAGREFLRITPTYPNKYKAGYYVTHGPFDSASVGETWYREPNSGEIENAWSGSLIATPQLINEAGNPKLIGISILPNKIKTQVGERRTVRVLGWEKDGHVRKEVDLTSKVSWRTQDPDTAFIKDAVVYPKRLGRTTIECELEGFISSAEIAIEHFSRGEKAIFLQGLRRLQQIKFDSDDNLYFCNQSASVYRSASAGGIEEVIRISQPDTYAFGVDCLAVDSKRNLYVNDMFRRVCLRFKWDGNRYSRPDVFANSLEGTKKSIAVNNNGDVFVAVMGGLHSGYILCVDPTGKETSFQTRDTAIYLAVNPEGHLCLPSASFHAVDIYSESGILISSLVHGIKETPTDILVDGDGAIFLPFWESGRIFRIVSVNSIVKVEQFAQFSPHIGGIAMDSIGRIYASVFGGNSVEMIF
jgi:Protein of unknown function (Hypoth_ymh)